MKIETIDVPDGLMFEAMISSSNPGIVHFSLTDGARIAHHAMSRSELTTLVFDVPIIDILVKKLETP